jgi:hypothetical protein
MLRDDGSGVPDWELVGDKVKTQTSADFLTPILGVTHESLLRCVVFLSPLWLPIFM